jgi:purine-binding chemotaxis protein CheW
VDRFTDSAAPRRFLTFRVADRLYALPAEDVAEIIAMPPVARLPLAPVGLLGLANSRGAVLPAVSLRVILGFAAKADTGRGARAIVLTGGEPVVLAVDSVDRLVSVNAGRLAAFEQAGLAADPGEALRGVFDAVAGQEVAKILDMPAMLAAAFMRRSRAPATTQAGAAPAVARSGQSAADQQSLVVFVVAGQEYALALEAVQEIVPFPETITVAPRAEAVLLGVAAYRNGLLPLHSLPGLLGLPIELPPAPGAKVLVVPLCGVLVGLVADAMRAVLRVNAHLIEPAPPMLAARTGGEARIKSIFRGDNGTRLISVLAPELLFREDVMQRLGDPAGGAARPAADRAEIDSGETLQLLVFRLADEEFGLPIGAVDEVTRVPDKITRLPRAPAFLEGVINLRGDVLPVVDQRQRFDMPRFESAEGRRLIVVRTERHRAGLIVDSVRQVLRAATASIEPAPDLSGGAHQVVNGVLNIAAAGRMVLLLDPDALLSQAEHQLLDAFDADPAEVGRNGS